LPLTHLCRGQRRPAIHGFAGGNYKIRGSPGRPGQDAWVNLAAAPDPALNPFHVRAELPHKRHASPPSLPVTP